MRVTSALALTYRIFMKQVRGFICDRVYQPSDFEGLRMSHGIASHDTFGRLFAGTGPPGMGWSPRCGRRPVAGGGAPLRFVPV